MLWRPAWIGPLSGSAYHLDYGLQEPSRKLRRLTCYKAPRCLRFLPKLLYPTIPITLAISTSTAYPEGMWLRVFDGVPGG
ncbi:hypothetical protein BJX66DRAFT_299431 [Aspergillus keveii]|uniref:Uncharacterized protein n=1 Tax=Aspergillus keveii TaxID=714993 RepID=A0ABR4GC21_9EURO